MTVTNQAKRQRMGCFWVNPGFVPGLTAREVVETVWPLRGEGATLEVGRALQGLTGSGSVLTEAGSKVGGRLVTFWVADVERFWSFLESFQVFFAG